MERTGWERIDELFEAALQQPAGERETFLLGATDDERLRAEVRALLHEHDSDPWFVDEPSAAPIGPPRAAAAPSPAPPRLPVVAAADEPPAALVQRAASRPQPGSAARPGGPAARPGGPAPTWPTARPLPPARGEPHAAPSAAAPSAAAPSAATPSAAAPSAASLQPQAPRAHALPRPPSIQSQSPRPTPPASPPAASALRRTPVLREPPDGQPETAPELAPGALFGAYRIIRQVGRGGMGAVYEAADQSGALPQQVTLRVLPPGWNTAAWTDWFRAACHLVAGLDHPWVARLLDGGVAEGGMPFVAMEHVAGEDICAYCRSRETSLPDRVRLVLRVCTALEYAHQRLIVHRSVGPKNILVTADGQLKVMNCGVARLLFGRPDSGEGLTRTGQSLFTPEYVSPEQARGELITAASDIYSLGVLLYVLLTDHPPYEFRDLTPVEMTRVICDTDPEPPSRVAPPSQRRALANDLDAVVMKALRKDPRMRYQSVTAFADDLRAWLHGRTVSVFPASRRQRAAKALRRHWLLAAVLGAAIAALGAGTALFGWQARALRAERDLAGGRLRVSQQFSRSLLNELHEAIAALPASAPARTAVLTRAVEQVDGLARDAAGDPAAALDLARAYRLVAALQAATSGGAPAGRASAAASLDAAVAAGERALAAEPESVEAAIALIAACGDAAALRQELGDAEAAGRADARHLGLVERLARQQPRDALARAAASSGYGRLGAFRAARGDLAGARMMYAYAAAGFETLAAENVLPAAARRDYAGVLRALGGFLLADGALDDADARFASAQLLEREDLAGQPGDESARRGLAASTGGLADVAMRRGDHAKAESLWLQALADAQASENGGADDAAAAEIAAAARGSLAELCRSQRRLDEALRHAREYARIRERLADAPGAPAAAALDLAVARTAVARVQLDVLDARPSSPDEGWRLRDAGALLTRAFPPIRAAAPSSAQQAALAEIERQTARFSRLTAARQP